MKPLKLLIRAWIALTAMLGFLGGWAILAHAGKPAPVATPAASSLAPLPALPPIPSLGQNQSPTRLQPLPSLPSIQFGSPRLRTGGS
jgi:hypothetical protein